MREAAERLTEGIDAAMAAVVLTAGGTLRQVGTLAGLSENAVGPRLARTEGARGLLLRERDGSPPPASPVRSTTWSRGATRRPTRLRAAAAGAVPGEAAPRPKYGADSAPTFAEAEEPTMTDNEPHPPLLPARPLRARCTRSRRRRARASTTSLPSSATVPRTLPRDAGAVRQRVSRGLTPTSADRRLYPSLQLSPRAIHRPAGLPRSAADRRQVQRSTRVAGRASAPSSVVVGVIRRHGRTPPGNGHTGLIK